MNKVTILIPTFNRGRLIGKTLNNCFKQSFRDFNVLVYDDGSKDRTEEIVKNQIKKYGPTRIQYIKGLQNKGIGYSRKFLLENLQTEYGVWLDSDDFMREDRLERCFKYMEGNQDVDVVYSYIQRFEERDNVTTCIGNPILVDTSRYDKKNYRSLKSNTTCATAFFRKKLASLEIVPLRYGSEDVLWLWRILNNDVKVGQISEPLYLYRSHKNRLSVEKRNLKKEEKEKEEGIIHEKIKEYQNG